MEYLKGNSSQMRSLIISDEHYSKRIAPKTIPMPLLAPWIKTAGTELDILSKWKNKLLYLLHLVLKNNLTGLILIHKVDGWVREEHFI